MGKYLGRENAYGMFTTQDLPVNGEQKSFNLTHKVGGSASVLVVSNGAVLRPDVDYVVTNGGTQVVFLDDAPIGHAHVLYLGRELQVPIAQNVSNFSVLHQAEGNGTQTTFTMPIAALVPTGILVIQDGKVLRYKNVSVRGDYTVDGSSVIFEVAPADGNELDFYIFGTRTNLALPDPGTISGVHIQDGVIGAEKLNITYTPYESEISTFGGMVASSISIAESEYQDIGKIVKVRMQFSVVLSGTPDNKIRFTLPQSNMANTNVCGTATLSSSTSIESGILKWGSDGSVDIYRQFGVNYILDEWSVELTLEYKTT
jgi:hypothetical protein